jgi:cell division protein FtsB
MPFGITGADVVIALFVLMCFYLGYRIETVYVIAVDLTGKLEELSKEIDELSKKIDELADKIESLEELVEDDDDSDDRWRPK